MEEQVVQILKEVNIVQILIILAGLWIFYRRVDAKIDRLEQRLEEKIDKLEQRIDRLEEKVDAIDKRLCRIEGSLSTQGHCLFSQSNPDKKVG
jgi:hypothetical protein